MSEGARGRSWEAIRPSREAGHRVGRRTDRVGGWSSGLGRWGHGHSEDGPMNWEAGALSWEAGGLNWEAQAFGFGNHDRRSPAMTSSSNSKSGLRSRHGASATHMMLGSADTIHTVSRT